ncbi:hypothetical protein [Salinicoccus albus]|uniref:hypothetical protein n=1 Tax=Salinicoccus albus TaxID=418756 RepID=UPI000378F46F|nr:hypothetical protein [Salinicoccus albus]
MSLKEFKMLSAVFVFVLVSGLFFMLQSHSKENIHSEIIYIDEFQIIDTGDEQKDIMETGVPPERYAGGSSRGDR